MQNKKFQKDKLNVEIYESKQDLGLRAANFAAEKLSKVINEKGSANLILATGASLDRFASRPRSRTQQLQQTQGRPHGDLTPNGHSLCIPWAYQSSGVHTRCRYHFRTRDRCKHRHLQRGLLRVTCAFSLRTTRQTGPDMGHQ